jgi:hypothetical protein
MEPVKTDGEIKEWFIVGFDEFGSCLDTLQIPNFYILSITSNFRHIYGALNIDNKITNCTVWM